MMFLFVFNECVHQQLVNNQTVKVRSCEIKCWFLEPLDSGYHIIQIARCLYGFRASSLGLLKKNISELTDDGSCSSTCLVQLLIHYRVGRSAGIYVATKKSFTTFLSAVTKCHSFQDPAMMVSSRATVLPQKYTGHSRCMHIYTASLVYVCPLLLHTSLADACMHAPSAIAVRLTGKNRHITLFNTQ